MQRWSDSLGRGALALGLILASTGCNGVNVFDDAPEELSEDEQLVEEEHEIASCVQRDLQLPDNFVLRACESQLRDAEFVDQLIDRATQPKPAKPELDIGVATQTISGGREPTACEWVRLDTVAKGAYLACPEQTYVVAGGCVAETLLGSSGPWEDQCDPVGNGVAYHNVHPVNGWMCVLEGGTADMHLTALCCE